MTISPLTCRNLLAALALVASAGLTGCMGPRLFDTPLPRHELRELRRSAHEGMDLRLVGGKTLPAVEFLGRVGVAGQDFLVFETEKQEHILIRADQIAAIALADDAIEKDRDEAGPGEKEEARKNGEKKKDGEKKEDKRQDSPRPEKKQPEKSGDKDGKDKPQDQENGRKNKEKPDGD